MAILHERPEDRDRFTLVELIVVISIIAVLTAILLPAMKKAKDMAKDVCCISNQKQVGLVFDYYAMDTDYLVYHSPYAIDCWAVFLTKNDYIPQRESLFEGGCWYTPRWLACPAMQEGGWYKGKLYPLWSYGVRMDKPVSIDGDTHFVSFYQRGKIPNPSTFSYLADTCRYSTKVPLYAYYQQANTYGVVSLRHNRSANLWCLDGHVAQVRIGSDFTTYYIGYYILE